MRFIIEKGSIAIDGISLTVARDRQRQVPSFHHSPHRRENHSFRKEKRRYGQSGKRLRRQIRCEAFAALSGKHEWRASLQYGSSDSSSHPASSGITADIFITKWILKDHRRYYNMFQFNTIEEAFRRSASGQSHPRDRRRRSAKTKET